MARRGRSITRSQPTRGSRQHPLAKALLEYGKLLRTLHALRWFTDEAFRQRIGRQLNRGEASNDLRRFIFFLASSLPDHPPKGIARTVASWEKGVTSRLVGT